MISRYLRLHSVVLASRSCSPTTPGRRGARRPPKIRVVKEDGGPVRFGTAFGREFLKVIFGITGILWVIDVLWPLWHPENRALHDLAAGTRVLTDRGTGL